MKQILIILVSLVLIACKSETKTSEPQAEKLKYSLKTVEIASQISLKIENNETVSDQEWEDLFSSEGYQAYFCAFDREDNEPQLKEAFYTVFDAANAQKLDSILQAPTPLTMEGRFNLMVQNFNEFKKNREMVEQFIENTDFQAILENANALTMKFLPRDVDAENVELHEVNFVMMEPNAYVTDCGLVVDFYNAYQMGVEGLTKTIAHEYHHNYRNTKLSIPGELLMLNLNGIQAEGIADLIDKGLPPYEKMMNLPQNIVESINEMYANTSQILSTLDSLTTAMLSGNLDEIDYNAKMMRYFKDGGHANGLYMSNKIKKAGLYQEMIATYDDPVAFLDLYNTAIEGQEGEHRFSDEFMNYIKELQKAHLEELNNLSDETYEVTFNVEVLNIDDKLYITGNQENLGDWDPGTIKLEQGTGNTKTMTLQLQSPAEFKFTGGSWDKEAIIEGQTGSDNLKLIFRQDTIVHYKIKNHLSLQ